MSEFPKPLFDNIIVERHEGRTVNGVIIPDTAEEVYVTIIAVGPGRWEQGVFVETTVKPGQICLLDPGPQGVGTFRWERKTYGVCPEKFVKVILPVRMAEPEELAFDGQIATLQ